MHELGITEAVVATVAERVPGGRVTAVRLEIGALDGKAAIDAFASRVDKLLTAHTGQKSRA